MVLGNVVRGALLAALFMAALAAAPVYAQEGPGVGENVGLGVTRASPQFVSATLDADGVLKITFDRPLTTYTINHDLITITDGLSPAGKIPLLAGEFALVDGSVQANTTLQYTLSGNKRDLVSSYADPRVRIDIGSLGPGLPAVGYRLPESLYPYEPDVVSAALPNNTEGAHQGLAFSRDGTVMFTVGTQLDTVFRYVLDQPHDISSARIEGNYSVGDREDNPRGLAFSPDGLKMFVVGNDTVHQYALGSQFGFSSAPSFEHNFSVAEDVLLTGIDFGNNGNRMYLSGENNSAIQQYDLSEAYDIEVQPVHAGNFSTADQYDSPRGVIVSGDGRIMLVLGQPDDKVFMYGMDEPHDISTAGYVGSHEITNSERNPEGIAASDDGRLIFVTGTVTNSVFRYNLGAPYDAARDGAGAGPTFDVSVIGRGPTGVVFSADGLQMFISSHPGSSVQSYDLAVPYAVTTATAADSYDTSIAPGLARDRPFDVEFSADGLWMFHTGRESANMYSYNLDTPYNITSATQNATFAITSEQTGVVFNPEGTIMLLAVTVPGIIQEYNLPSPFDISGAVAAPFSITDGLSPTGLEYSSDGHRLFIMDGTQTVHRYDLLTPYTLRDALFVDTEVFNDDGQPNDLTFSGDGRKMFIAGARDHNIHTYNLTAPYDITSSASPVSLSVDTGSPTPSDISVSTDGRTVLVFNNIRDAVIGHSLRQPYDLSTSASSVQSAAADNDNVNAMEFSPNGTLMFLSGWNHIDDGVAQFTGGRAVYTYNLSAPFDVSTIQLVGNFLTQDAVNALTGDDAITSPSAMRFSADGTDLYLIDEIDQLIHHFSLSSPYLLDNTTVYVEALDVNPPESNPSGLELSDDGTRLFITGAGSDHIRQYDMDIAYNLSTAVHSESINVGRLDTQARGLAFSEDGSRLFFVGDDTDRVYLLDLAAPEVIGVQALPSNLRIAIEASDTPVHSDGVTQPGKHVADAIDALLPSDLATATPPQIHDIAVSDALMFSDVPGAVRVPVEHEAIAIDALLPSDGGLANHVVVSQLSTVAVSDALMFSDVPGVDPIAGPIREEAIAIDAPLPSDGSVVLHTVVSRLSTVAVSDALMFSDVPGVDPIAGPIREEAIAIDAPLHSDDSMASLTANIAVSDALIFSDNSTAGPTAGPLEPLEPSDIPEYGDSLVVVKMSSVTVSDAPLHSDDSAADRIKLIDASDGPTIIDFPGGDIRLSDTINATDAPMHYEPIGGDLMNAPILINEADRFMFKENQTFTGLQLEINATDVPAIISGADRMDGSQIHDLPASDEPTPSDDYTLDLARNLIAFDNLDLSDTSQRGLTHTLPVSDAPSVSDLPIAFIPGIPRMHDLPVSDAPSVSDLPIAFIPGIPRMHDLPVSDAPSVSDLPIAFIPGPPQIHNLTGTDAPSLLDPANTELVVPPTYEQTVSDAPAVLDSGDSVSIPVVLSVSAESAAVRENGTVSITVTFSEAVNVTGTPMLGLDVGANANYTTGSGTPNLTFSYTVAADHNSAGLSYAGTDALAAGDGNITAVSDGDLADLTLPEPGSGSSLSGSSSVVIDTEQPSIVRILATGIDTLVATINEPLVITPMNITLEINGSSANVTNVTVVAGNNLLITTDEELPDTLNITVRLANVTDPAGNPSAMGDYNLTMNDKALLGDREVNVTDASNLLLVHDGMPDAVRVGDGTRPEVPLILYLGLENTSETDVSLPSNITVTSRGITIMLPKNLNLSGFNDTQQIIIDESDREFRDEEGVPRGMPVEVGLLNVDLRLDPPIRIDLVGEPGDLGYRIDSTSNFTVIDDECTENSAAGAAAQKAAGGACLFSDGNDFTIWTHRLSTYGLFTPPSVPDLGTGSGLTPAPLPRRGGGGGGGGGGGSVLGGTGFGYDASFEFSLDGENVLRGSSIRLPPGNTLVVAPVLTGDSGQAVFDMEILFNGADGSTSSVYYNRLGAFFGQQCAVEPITSGMVSTCDESSIIADAAVPAFVGGALESIAVPLEGEFTGTVSLLLRDNQGITLATHDHDKFSINTVGTAPDTRGPAGPDAGAPGTGPGEPEDAGIGGTTRAEPEPRTEPGQEPRAEPGDSRDPAGIPDGGSMGEPVDAEPAAPAGASRNLFEVIGDFLRSLFGFS